MGTYQQSDPSVSVLGWRARFRNRKKFRSNKKKNYAALGGWHLFQLNDERLEWTASKMREYGVQHFLGAHCTGVEAVYRIRQLNRMPRERCVVGAVGATFDLQRGISPGLIAR